MSEVELKMDDELNRVVAYLRDELKDAIMVQELKRIIEDEPFTINEQDARDHRKMVLAAKRLLGYYTVSGQ